MNAQSTLSRFDYEDFLVYLYFGATPNSDHLRCCIDRAYLDFSRTLHGMGKHPASQALRQQISGAIRTIFADVQSAPAALSHQAAFDTWHQATCERLAELFRQQGYQRLFVGQAQKWVNMTFKYIFTMGEQRLPGYQPLYSMCHAPLDSILVDKLQPYGAPPLLHRWSRLDNYGDYLAYQLWIRRHFALVPLDVEFKLWLGQPIE